MLHLSVRTKKKMLELRDKLVAWLRFIRETVLIDEPRPVSPVSLLEDLIGKDYDDL